MRKQAARHCALSLPNVGCGVRRHGKLIAGDIQRHIDTLRTMIQQEHRSETWLERLEQVERVVPTMQATIECVSGDVRQGSKRVNWTWRAYLLHPAHPSHSLLVSRARGLQQEDQGGSTPS